MKKKIIYIVFLLVAILKINITVKADPTNSDAINGNPDGTISDAETCSKDSKKKAIKYAFQGEEYEFCYGDNEGVYCASSQADSDFFNKLSFPPCFLIRKNIKKYDEYLKIYGIPLFQYQVKNGFGELRESSIAEFITSSDDPIINSYGTWWSSSELCYTRNQISLFESTYSWYAYTDTLSSITGSEGWVGTSDCVTYEAKNIDSSNIIYYCSEINRREDKISALIQKYKESPKASIVSDYKVIVSEIEGLCGSVLQSSNYNEACLNRCLTINKSIDSWNSSFNLSSGGIKKCGFSMRLISWIINIVKWVKFIIPVLVIILGILDFIKATSSEKDDEIKKAQGNFVKRLIAAALIFLIPAIVEFILPKFGFDYNSCGIF